jgi:hypothetical protein
MHPCIVVALEKIGDLRVCQLCYGLVRKELSKLVTEVIVAHWTQVNVIDSYKFFSQLPEILSVNSYVQGVWEFFDENGVSTEYNDPTYALLYNKTLKCHTLKSLRTTPTCFDQIMGRK